jgi:hypothetical protein
MPKIVRITKNVLSKSACIFPRFVWTLSIIDYAGQEELVGIFEGGWLPFAETRPKPIFISTIFQEELCYTLSLCRHL